MWRSSRGMVSDASSALAPDAPMRRPLALPSLPLPPRPALADGPALAFVLLNPSMADETVDDQTVRRSASSSRSAHGYGGLEVVNLYVYIATDPNDLRRAKYPVGPDNDMHIAAGCASATGWCWHGGRGCSAESEQKRSCGCCVAWRSRRTAFASPAADIHPLRLPSTCGLQLFRAIDPGAGRGA